jgi:hypothetical protein
MYLCAVGQDWWISFILQSNLAYVFLDNLYSNNILEFCYEYFLVQGKEWSQSKDNCLKGC